jgi:hypothetical protein
MAEMSTATAIVAGSIVIGVCLGAGAYFGLRERGGARAGAPVAVAASGAPLAQAGDAVAASGDGPGSRGSPPGAGPAAATASDRAAMPTDEATDRATLEATAQFESARADLVKKCWVPAASKPGPATTKFRMHLLLDSQGRQMGRSFLESGAVKPGVAQCVNVTLASVSVTPPGARLTLDVPLALP